MLWPVFLLLGLERVRIAPGITACSPFDFVHYPWSHSLVMAVVWSLVFGGMHYAIRRDMATAKVMAVVVFSHWVLDWVTHRPDLPLAPGVGFRTGLGLWNSIPATVAVEVSIFAAAAWWYQSATEPVNRTGSWAFFTFVAALLIGYAASFVLPPHEGQERMVAIGAIAMWLFIPWAAWADRHRVVRG
jgi:membrane-bound metal-dependent hydrolase YbcI (DUF457 family)